MTSFANQEIELLVQRYPVLSELEDQITQTVQLLIKTYRNGGKVLVCGNGGSAADSAHIVGELMKSFVLKRKINRSLQEKFMSVFPEDADYYINNLQEAIPSISLVNEVSLMTAYGNDNVSDLVYAQQVLGYGQPGDVLIAISTSGNSGNVLHATKVAKVLGMNVVSMTGKSGGKVKEYSDILLNVPSDITYQIQELHLPVYHAICLALEQELFHDHQTAENETNKKRKELVCM